MSAKPRHFRNAGFTLVELMVAVGVFGFFSVAVMTTWMFLQNTSLSVAAYTARQSDQMRAVDYLKRDIRRAASVAIYNGASLVSGTASGTELRLTIPDYYTDTRQEDDAYGTSTATTPSLSGTAVTYGTALTIRYYVSGGAVIRNESGVLRQLADSAGAFSLSFSRLATGEVSTQITYAQPVRTTTAGNQTINRTVSFRGSPRTLLMP